MRKLSDVFKSNSGYQMFFFSMITFGLSYGLYKGIIDNYLAEIVSMTSFDKGADARIHSGGALYSLCGKTL